ncbi:hypothetical protein AB0I28_16250 [Phytomonospora sp. NPDC050363]|uniref:hypothetical protein n=1 Tax=Phytomonospora sp. NPDC050363 TaxID=3155642 RepID=UPI0033C8084D
MREHAGTATASRPDRDDRRAAQRPPHPLLALQAKAGNRAVAGLVAVQRCGPIPHDQCPCNTDEDTKVQRLADGAGLVAGFAAPPGSFGAGLPELSGSLAELRAGDGPDSAGKIPVVDQRPGKPAARAPAASKPVSDPKLGPPRTPAPVSPPVTALDSGPRPVLELTGEADPALAHRAGDAALGELGAVATESGQEAAADHGENAVGEAAPPVRVAPPQGVQVPPVSLNVPAIAASGGDSPAMAQAESSVGGWLTERTGAVAASLRAEESAGRDRVDKAVGEGEVQVAKATADTTARQQALGGGVQQDVAGERSRWTTAATSMHTEHAASTKAKLSALDAGVGGVVGEADRGAKREYASAEQAAKAQQAKDPSLLDRAAGALNSLKQAVGGLFDRAKQAAKGLYDAARAKVAGLVGAFADAVRAGAAAVAGKIRAIAAQAKAAIAAKIRAAVDAVTKAATDLAAFGRRILDGVGAAIRAGLAAIGRATRAAVDALGKAAEAIRKALAVVGQLMAKVEAYGPFPQGMYAWAERWGKLADDLPAGATTAQLAAKPPTPSAPSGGGGDPLGAGDAGGCGVCKGSPGVAGTAAHGIISGVFTGLYPNSFAPYPVRGAPGQAGSLAADLAIDNPGGPLELGEIKPGHAKGFGDGVGSIAKYLPALMARFPGRQIVPLTKPIPPAFYPNPEGGPTCPTQKLFVFPPVGGIYGYFCIPEFKELIASGKCKCKKEEPPDPPPVPVDVKEKDKAKDKDTEKDKEKEKEKGKDDVPDGPLPDPAYAKAIQLAIIVLCAAIAALLLWPEPIGKAVSAVVGIASFAALMLMISKAEDEGRPTA